MQEHTLRNEILELKRKLQDKETALQLLLEKTDPERNIYVREPLLSNSEINRYSRQMIMSEIGMKGQQALKMSSVLIVGAGGLGSPAGFYLAGAGIGHIAMIDYDFVELNNLHRQILHSEATVSLTKAKSAEEMLKSLNSNIKITTYQFLLDSSNALDMVKKFDVVIDASDNVATRYLLNDACVLTKRPLVSGSALQFEGQLTVYNYNDGPCYRCLFPVPPPPESVTSCGDGGVLGVVPGVIGVLQAMEAIKIVLRHSGVLTKRLLLFDGSDCIFRNVRLRDRNPSCSVCGNEPTITALIDYEQFCGTKANDKVCVPLELNLSLPILRNLCTYIGLKEHILGSIGNRVRILNRTERISAKQYRKMSSEPHILVDVRSPMEFEICHLPGSLNMPLKDLSSESVVQQIKEAIAEKHSGDSKFPVFVVCRRGNDSQKGVRELQKSLQGLPLIIKDIVGGLHSWAFNVDPSFPIY